MKSAPGFSGWISWTVDCCLSTNIVHIWEQLAEFCGHTEHSDAEIPCWRTPDGSLDRLLDRVEKLTVRWIGLWPGWIGLVFLTIIVLLIITVS